MKELISYTINTGLLDGLVGRYQNFRGSMFLQNISYLPTSLYGVRNQKTYTDILTAMRTKSHIICYTDSFCFPQEVVAEGGFLGMNLL